MRARPLAVAGTRRPSWLRRLWLLAQAVLYALSGWATIRSAAATTRPITLSDLDAPGSPPGLRAIVLAVGLVLAAVGAAAYELAAAVYRREPLDVGEPERHRRWTRS